MLFVCLGLSIAAVDGAAFLDGPATGRIMVNGFPRLAFLPQPRRKTLSLFQSSVLQQLPGESDSDFFKRITSLASDSSAFEKMVRDQHKLQHGGGGHTGSGTKSHQRHSSTKLSATRTLGSLMNDDTDTTGGGAEQQQEGDDEPPRRRGYQRAEDWDAEQSSKGDHIWQQKAQFDGQRYGNQFRQNEVLRHHLNTF